MKKALITALVIILCLPMFAFGQRNRMRDRSMYYSYGEKLYADYFLQSAESPDSINILVSFRILFESISFKKDDRTGGYTANPEAEIICRDENNIIRKREMWRTNIHVDDYETTASKEDYAFGSVDFNMPAGSYSIEIELLDMPDSRDNEYEFELDKKLDFSVAGMITPPVFGRLDSKGKLFEPFVLDNDIAFGAKNTEAIMGVSYRSPEEYEYSCAKIEKKGDKRVWGEEFTITGKANLMERKILRIESCNNSGILYSINERNDNGGAVKQGLLSIDLPSVDMPPGDYRLKVFVEGIADTMTYNFRVRWHNMPLSLRSPEYAAEVMYYILTEDKHDELDDGSEQEVFQKIIDYWEQFDPTPDTEFNEAMATYFERVDHAFFNFQTLSQKDGAKTERGKIYILHGQPDDIRKEHKEKMTKEIWTYKNLNKEFIFEMVSTGKYKLREIRSLQSSSK
jgi:GWxTD domain-containing protein